MNTNTKTLNKVALVCKTALLVLFCLFSTLPLLANCNNIPNSIAGFDYLGTHGDSKYFISVDKKTWDQAFAACTNAGGHLVVITSLAENNVLDDNITKEVWIGYTDQNQEGNFEWINGDPSTYNRWTGSEPDDSSPSNSTVADHTIVMPNGLWRDRHKNESYHFVMEIPCNTCFSETTGFLFDDLNGNNDVTIEDGGTYTLSQLPSSYRLQVLTNGYDESVSIELNGTLAQNATESYEPYTLPSGSTNAISLIIGNYTLTTTNYTEDNLGGNSCAQRTISFSIIPENTTVDCQSISNNIAGLSYIGTFENSRYFKSNSSASWHAAANTAAAVGGHLAAISSAAENTFLAGHISSRHWIGLHDSVTEGSYEWENGEPLVYTNFPSNEYPTANEDFINLLDDGKWRDKGLNNSYPFLVEIPCPIVPPCPTSNFEGGKLEATACDNFSIVIESSLDPDYQGEALEIVWLEYKNNTDCSAALNELSNINLGAEFDTFLVEGGFSASANAQIGGTGWSFVKDNDANDKRLNLFGITEPACYLRYSRKEGCTDFLGEAGPITVLPSDCIDCDAPFDGGIIIQDDGAVGYTVIENFASPGSNGGLTVESIWLSSTNIDTLAALAELETINIGLLFNGFLNAGGFGVADPQIPGTSWFFTTDNDTDDLSLSNVNGPACFLRCSRNEGCTDFHSGSNIVVVSPAVAPLAPMSYELCDNTVSVNGLKYGTYNFFKVYSEDFSSILYECSDFIEGCTDPLSVELPNGTYIIDAIAMDENFNELFRLTETISLPENCAAPLINRHSEPNIVEDLSSAESQPEPETTIKINSFPNPADQEFFLKSPYLEGKAVRLRIFNTVGQLILDRPYQQIEMEQIQVDVSNFQSGIYIALLQVKAEREFAIKFVVNRKAKKE